MAATAAALLRGSWVSKSIKVSHKLEDLGSRQVNIVHVRRPEAAATGFHAQHLLQKQTTAVIDLDRHPEAAISYLVDSIPQPDLQQRICTDIQQAAQQICTVRHTGHVRAKLECITRQSCPQFHADTVGIRLLCTYMGPGTWYIDNRHVERHCNPWTGTATVIGVDEQYAVQTAAGDLLYLKGNLCEGMTGVGAVHKSPEMLPESEARLLLTVDDACCSG